MSCDRVQIICMHRLSVLCHNVVRDIYQVIDWPDTCCSQTSLHPLRARSDFDIFADPCAVTGAQIGILYFYVHIIVYILAVACTSTTGGMNGFLKVAAASLAMPKML